jgi:hypothetical protein
VTIGPHSPGSTAAGQPVIRRGPLRLSNLNNMSAWPHAVRRSAPKAPHFHDLSNTGNHFATASGASLRDPMARMAGDSERAAIIYQHEARGADAAITSAIDAHRDCQIPRGPARGGLTRDAL